MSGRRGLEADVLVSLVLVMIAATGSLCAIFLKAQQVQLRELRHLAARSLVEVARASPTRLERSLGHLHWWRQREEGAALEAVGIHADWIGQGDVVLAEKARRDGGAVLRASMPWKPIDFAIPTRIGSEVIVARLPPSVFGSWLLMLLCVDVAIFTGFGAYLLRRRLIVPLQRLAEMARSIADGAFEARVPVEGVRETAEVARAFNDMTRALEERTQSLEKAVADLRESNRDLREARAGLDRAERLAAVGRLAAGVAHEVGNPMGAILGFIDLASREEGLSAAGRGHLERAVREGGRVRGILRQLLDFSKPVPSTRESLDLEVVCEETAGLVRAQKRYRGIEIEIASGRDLPALKSDPARIAQILLNLLLNAGDAIRAEVSQPQIRIGLRAAVRDPADRASAAETEARAEVGALECVVSDNGPGIPAEDRERIFDPFFSTKEPGEGTGLGLANALRFAEELGGSLTLEGSESVGATFVLRLPVLPERGRDSRTRSADRG